jgi:hypothetical protein
MPLGREAGGRQGTFCDVSVPTPIESINSYSFVTPQSPPSSDRASRLLRYRTAILRIYIMKPSFVLFKPLILASSICITLAAQARELSLIRGKFSGGETEITGTASAVFTPNNPKFRLDFRHLEPNATYNFTVDGILEETLTTDHRGGLHLDFRLNPTGRKLPLDFDPRGKILALDNGTEQVASMIFSGEGEPADIRVDERTRLVPVDPESSGRVDLRYLEQRNKDRFIVHLHSLDRGNYELYIDGQLQAEIDMNRGRSTMRSFEVLKNAQGAKKPGNGNGHGNSKKLELNFDPRGLIVDLVKDDAILFSGEMLAQIEGINDVQVGETTTVLAPTSADADATGTATVTLGADEDLTFTVAVGALAPGDYEVVVEGVVRGTITVTGTDPATTGEIIFSSDPEAGELLLDFDPLGKTLEIRQGATVFLTGEIALSLTELAPPTTVETELPLLNQGVTAAASSHVTLVEDGTALTTLEVEVEGLAAGNYDFKVGAVVKGIIVVTDVDGVLSGKIIFANDGVALPLDFDPRGQTVTIEQTGTVYFSRPL